VLVSSTTFCSTQTTSARTENSVLREYLGTWVLRHLGTRYIGTSTCPSCPWTPGECNPSRSGCSQPTDASMGKENGRKKKKKKNVQPAPSHPCKVRTQTPSSKTLGLQMAFSLFRGGWGNCWPTPTGKHNNHLSDRCPVR
jgi:hypothetical protein